MNPPCPASECVHMWGPSLIGSLKDKSLHNSLRQPALDLINILIISDASALISFKMKYESFTKGDVINSVIFVDDDDELPVFCDAEEMDYGCWNDFNVLYKLTCRECKDWRCVPLLWYLIMVQLEPSELPMAFSKAVFWALSHISVLEPGVSTESSVPVNDWLSSHAGEVLPTFSWQVPNGADDGGVGKECINTLKVSQSCTLLLKIFKRFAIHVIMQIEQRGLLKQWAWESMMAESLILTLVDHNDNLRQVGRAVLELASQGRGLTSGLQFLCSSASSLTATFLGLRYAVQSVETKSVLADFPSLHHLFFVICKLLKDVVVQQPSVALQAKPFEGGFLRQSFSNVSVNLPQHSVDIISWEKFSTLLSGALWPFIFTCLRKGDDLINTKQCQISCVRLLELVPLVYERVSSYSSAKSCGVPTMVLDPTDITWLFHLINWGKSSLLVIIRHWKQCMLSLIKILKGSLGGTVQHYIEDLGSIISHDAVNIDELSEKISDLKLALSKEASAKSERRVVAGVSMFTEPIAGIPSPATQTAQERNTGRDNVETMKSSRSTCTEHIILLSDSEENSLTADVSGEDVLSSVKDSDGSGTSDMQKEVEHSEPRMPTEDRHVSLKQQICSPASDIVASSKPVSKDRSIIAAKEGLGRAKIPTVPVNTNDTSLLPKKIKPPASTISQPSRSNLSSGAEKFKSIFRDLSDDEDDPLEHALDSCRKPQIRLTKSCLLVPKRQVVQLPLSAEKRHTSGRPDASSRRLKPPKLDSWFKNILEMDYFAVVGLPSSEIIKKLALKEIPVCFDSQAQYVEIFQPLVLEEFKAQLQNAYVETPAEDMNCGSISILSVERVDEFLVVRGRPDKNDCLKSKNCMENDLILLSKDPLNSSGQQVHVLGKVDRRESDKTKALILVIKFFLSNENARLNKVKRLLVERSKWFLNRIMSMTPQVREFSALSSLNDIPVLPVILNPVSCKSIHHGSGKVHLDKLSHPMRKVLKSSYNDSQLEAVSIAIRSTSLKAKFDLSLIQGPPGTGKTRTIVAIVSALLSLHAANSSQRNESFASAEFNKPRPRLSQSVAVTRAWQDAALAKQLINDSQREVPTDRLSKGRVLVCAQSNAAVDELVSRLSEGLYDTDGKLYKPYIVRVGNAKTVHSNSVPFFIDTLVEQRLADELKKNNDSKSLSDTESSSSLRANLEKIVDRIRYYELRRKLLEADKTENDSLVPSDYETDEVSDDAIGAKLNFLYAQKRKVSAELATAHAREKKIADENRFLKHKVRKSILGEAEIVVTTLSGCGGDIYSVCSETASANKFVNFSEHALFDVVVIDEAAQALEPATLIPLQLLKSKGTKCIMVGDPKQLPATVMSGLASKFLYECSMFERLQRAGYPVIMLTKQYRMHPEISRFPSLHFYENKLLDGAQAADKSAPFHGHDCLGPYMFFDVADGREQCGKNAATQSLCNQFEAEAALEILGFLKNRYPSEFSCRKIGIITPYRSQLSLLRSRFNSFFGPEIVAEMEINTVDGFQGREVDILVLSTVRASNSSDSRHHTGEARSIGFVADVRRMNVALTRARFSLWIVGNAKTLQTNSHWASLLQNAKERNLFISVNRPYRSLFEKVRSHSEDIHGSRHTYYTSHCKKKESGKNSMTNSQKIDARPHKEHARHTVRTVETANERLPNDQAKRASRWDRKSPKAHEPFHRKSSKEKEPVIQDTDQDNAVRKEKEGEGLTIHNDNSLELANVIRQRELNKPVKPNIHTDAGKTLCNQDSLQNSEVRKDVNKKYDNGNVKGSQNHDTKATVMKIDASPPAQDMQKLIQKAKGARKFSEKPRFGNSSQVDSSVKHEATLESANKNGGACTPTNSEMKKMAGKAKKARRFSEHPRSGNSNKVDHSLPSFDEESSQMPELKENNLTATRQNHLTASRKRQREDIESLLSSALVSSKKPSSKCPSKKQK
jgi:superfamily I DNA and/or RNA helicase